MDLADASSSSPKSSARAASSPPIRATSGTYRLENRTPFGNLPVV